MLQQGASNALTCVARDVGASRAWLLALSPQELLDEVIRLPEGSSRVTLLEGTPVMCADVRALGKTARLQGLPLVVDNGMAGFGGCPSVRLGAHLAFAQVGEGQCLVALSRDAENALPSIGERIERSPQVSEAQLSLLDELLAQQARAWRARSDAAQVVASYLRCHPKVAQVRYPGLKSDPSFAVAARTLQGGFGPLVDWQGCGSDGWERLTCTDAEPREQIMELEHALL